MRRWILKVLQSGSSQWISRRPVSSSVVEPKMHSSLPTDMSDFISLFPTLATQLSKDPSTPELHQNLSEHISSLLHYTVPGGKMNRGLSVPSTYKLLVSSSKSSSREMHLARVLGWTVELLQAYFLVADDIMDGSITRRGQPCWYKKQEIGLGAFNDSLILEACVYNVIRTYFRSEPFYIDVLENMLEVSKFTTYGQSLDTLSAHNFSLVRGQPNSLDNFNMSRYSAIVKYKTSYYSFYLPVVLAMNMAGVKDKSAFDGARTILLEIGHYFQVTDDYLDCYGDPAVTGKIGTDIEDGKCSWLIVKALEIANEDQKNLLCLHYGSHDVKDVDVIKDIYLQLGVREMYNDYEEKFYKVIMDDIDSVCKNNVLPKEVFTSFLEKVFRRSK